MLRLDASVAAIAERAISSYDYVHATISTYPPFFCMNFDICALVASMLNSVHTYFVELFGEKVETVRLGTIRFLEGKFFLEVFFRNEENLLVYRNVNYAL